MPTFTGLSAGRSVRLCLGALLAVSGCSTPLEKWVSDHDYTPLPGTTTAFGPGTVFFPNESGQSLTYTTILADQAASSEETWESRKFQSSINAEIDLSYAVKDKASALKAALKAAGVRDYEISAGELSAEEIPTKQVLDFFRTAEGEAILSELGEVGGWVVLKAVGTDRLDYSFEARGGGGVEIDAPFLNAYGIDLSGSIGVVMSASNTLSVTQHRWLGVRTLSLKTVAGMIGSRSRPGEGDLQKQLLAAPHASRRLIRKVEGPRELHFGQSTELRVELASGSPDDQISVTAEAPKGITIEVVRAGPFVRTIRVSHDPPWPVSLTGMPEPFTSRYMNGEARLRIKAVASSGDETAVGHVVHLLPISPAELEQDVSRVYAHAGASVPDPWGDAHSNVRSWFESHWWGQLKAGFPSATEAERAALMAAQVRGFQKTENGLGPMWNAYNTNWAEKWARQSFEWSSP